MVSIGVIICGKGDYLALNQEEHLVPLQLVGSDPPDIARCASKTQQSSYDEVNINVGSQPV